MFDSSQIIRISIQNDMVDSVTAIGNGENQTEVDEISIENLHSENADDIQMDDVDDSMEPPSNKLLKLEIPEFIQPKPIASWKVVPVDDQKRNTKLGIETICPNVCNFFLHDDCIEGEHCYNSHELPTDDMVRQRLIDRGVENTEKLFRVIIARCPKLLQRYFHVFVDIFAEHQSKEYLIGTICICERESNKDKRFELFQQLIKAFIKCGETYKTAMETILFNVENMGQDMVNTLLNMNLVDGIGVSDFLAVFRSLNKHRYMFNKHIINRLMYLCTQSEDALPTEKLIEFSKLIFSILKNNKHVHQNKSLDQDYYKSYMSLYNRNRNRNGKRKFQ